jgi:hypothetical protein
MQETKLLGTLLHALPELQEIAKSIRGKYGIPEVNIGDDSLANLLLVDPEIDWQAVEADIQAQVREHPNVLPDHLKPFLLYKDAKDWPDDPNIYEPISEDFRQKVTFLYKFFVHTARSFSIVGKMIDDCYDVIAKNLLRYIMTGQGTEVPSHWIGVVTTAPMFGENIVIAMAGELTDPKWIAKEFRSQLTNTFGKKRPKITKETLTAAELYGLKLTGKKLKDIVDIDMARNPSNYPTNKKSKKYKTAIETRTATIKKRLQRLRDTLEALVRDSS